VCFASQGHLKKERWVLAAAVQRSPLWLSRPGLPYGFLTQVSSALHSFSFMLPFTARQCRFLDCEVRLTTGVGPPAFLEKRLGSLLLCCLSKVVIPFSRWNTRLRVVVLESLSSAYFLVPRVPPPHRNHHVNHRLLHWQLSLSALFVK
jgi:hypothetical protein